MVSPLEHTAPDALEITTVEEALARTKFRFEMHPDSRLNRWLQPGWVEMVTPFGVTVAVQYAVDTGFDSSCEVWVTYNHVTEANQAFHSATTSLQTRQDRLELLRNKFNEKTFDYERVVEQLRLLSNLDPFSVEVYAIALERALDSIHAVVMPVYQDAAERNSTFLGLRAMRRFKKVVAEVTKNSAFS